MTRIPSIVAAQRAAFAATRVMFTPTTASNMGRGQITVIASTDARKAAQPVPPATMSTLTILLRMENGQAPATPSISAREPARSAKLPTRNMQTTLTRTATESATTAAQQFR